MMRVTCGVVLVLLVLTVRPGAVVAQYVVEGRVVSAATGAPLADVTVRVPGEGLLLGTDSLGRFRIEVAAERRGVALRLEVIGYHAIDRTWMLPLDRPIVIGLEREAVELDGIDVEVRLPVLERMHMRLRANPGLTYRTADRWQLRRFEHQDADLYDFLPDMTVAVGILGCDECLMMNGTMEARFFVDDFEVEPDHFRSFAVREICRVEVVRQPPPITMSSKIVEADGGVHAYTCDFMEDLESGETTLSPFLGPWDSMMGDPAELGRPAGIGPGGGGV